MENIYIETKNMISFLEYVYQYSIEKRKQIELAIKYQKEIKINHLGNKDTISLIELEQRKWFHEELKRLKCEKYDERELKNYENEIKKLSIPKETREGKQALIPGFTLEELYRERGITENKEIVRDDSYFIPEMSDDIKIGYLAGFFDGEGCVRIHRNPPSNPRYRLHITMVNSNFGILKMYINKFGGDIHKDELKKERYKYTWQWYILSNSALLFLKWIEPYTIVKREQIKLAIEFKEWQNSLTGRGITTYEQKQKAEWYYNKIVDLKKETGEDKFEDNIACSYQSKTDENQAKLEFEI